VWDVATGREVAPVERDVTDTKAGFDDSGSLLATLGADGQLRVRDLQSDSAEWLVPVPSPRVVDVAFSPNGEMLATAAEAGYLHLWR
jgi:WD40 repeat protein